MPDEVIMPPVHPGEILLTEFLEPLDPCWRRQKPVRLMLRGSSAA